MGRRRTVGIAVMVVAVGAGVLLWAVETAPDRRFREYVDAMRAAHELDTGRASHAPRDEDNAAREIEAALTWIDGTVGTESEWPWRERVGIWPWSTSDADLAETRRFAQRVRPFASRVAVALDRPRCWFAPAHGVSDKDVLPSVLNLHLTVCTLRAITRFAEDPDEQVEACGTLVRLAAKLDELDPAGGWRVSEHMEYGLSELRSGIESNRWDPRRTLARVEEFLLESWLPRITTHFRSIRGGIVTLRLEYLEEESGRGLLDSIGKRWRRMTRGPSRRELAVRSPEGTIAAAELFRKVGELPTTSYLRLVTGFRQLNRSMGQSFGDQALADVLARIDAATRLARVSLAAAEHRATHGDFPASLDELKPMFADGIPLDPYTDAPFVYETTPTGVRIASVGRLADEPALDAATLRERCLVWELTR